MHLGDEVLTFHCHRLLKNCLTNLLDIIRYTCRLVVIFMNKDKVE